MGILNLIYQIVFLPFFSLAATNYTVAVDPGHGGEDQGAVRSHYREAKIVLGISTKLTKLLNKNKSFQAFLTRQGNTPLTLQQRSKMAQQKRADLFVSIHANASTDVRSRGMELYIRNELEPDMESLRLAHQEKDPGVNLKTTKVRHGDLQSIVNDLRRSANIYQSYELSWHLVKNWKVPLSKIRRNPIKQGPFYVLHKGRMPSLLVEVGFVSNPKEAARLNSPAYQQHIAQTIYAGLKDFKETLDKGQSKALK